MISPRSAVIAVILLIIAEQPAFAAPEPVPEGGGDDFCVQVVDDGYLMTAPETGDATCSFSVPNNGVFIGLISGQLLAQGNKGILYSGTVYMDTGGAEYHLERARSVRPHVILPQHVVYIEATNLKTVVLSVDGFTELVSARQEVFVLSEGDLVALDENSGGWFYRKDADGQEHYPPKSSCSTSKDATGALWLAIWMLLALAYRKRKT